METLDALAPGSVAHVAQIEGNVRLATRLASIGLVPGSRLEVVRNDSRRPVLVYERDTQVAINREEAAHIHVEVEGAGGEPTGVEEVA